MESIDRLREYAETKCGWGVSPEVARHIKEFADEIEQEYKQTIHDAVNKAHADGERNALRQEHSASEDYRRGYLEAMSKVEGEYIKLPVDADGEPIHVGDVMEFGDVGQVQHLELWDGAWVAVVEYEPGRFTRWSPEACRHHRAPTVEDVLREFLDAIDIDKCYDFDATIAEYAAKLRLAGDE